MTAIWLAPAPVRLEIVPIAAPVLSFTVSPTVKLGAADWAPPPGAVALAGALEPLAEGAADWSGCVEVDGVEGFEEGDGLASDGLVDGEVIGGFAAPLGEVGAPAPCARAWLATARARPAARRGVEERIQVSLRCSPQEIETASGEDRSGFEAWPRGPFCGAAKWFRPSSDAPSDGFRSGSTRPSGRENARRSSGCRAAPAGWSAAPVTRPAGRRARRSRAPRG